MSRFKTFVSNHVHYTERQGSRPGYSTAELSEFFLQSHAAALQLGEITLQCSEGGSEDQKNLVLLGLIFENIFCV